MIITYFKDNKLVGFTNNGIGGVPEEFDIQDNSLTENDIAILINGGTYLDGTVTPEEFTDEEILLAKKLECQTKILENYSWSDQANITGDSIVSGDNTEFVKMRTFINAMLDEFHTNGIDSDYTDITP